MNLTLIRGLLCLPHTNYTHKFRKTTNRHVFAAEAKQALSRHKNEPAAEAVLIFSYRSDNRSVEKGDDRK
uniref:Uncharacterized protein n=1 Tax=Sphingobacterium sp. (strain 21) TaxID=743722 RepID=F4C134_SPHS2